MILERSGDALAFWIVFDGVRCVSNPKTLHQNKPRYEIPDLHPLGVLSTASGGVVEGSKVRRLPPRGNGLRFPGLRKVWKIDDSQTMCKTPRNTPKGLEHTFQIERLKVSCTPLKVESSISKPRWLPCTIPPKQPPSPIEWDA